MLCRDDCLPVAASPGMGFQGWPGPALLLLSSKQEEALLAPSVTSVILPELPSVTRKKGVHSDCAASSPDVTVELPLSLLGGMFLVPASRLCQLPFRRTRRVHLAVSTSAAFSQIQKVVSGMCHLAFLDITMARSLVSR